MELKLETLNTTYDYLERFSKGIIDTTQYLREVKYEQAQDMTIQIIDGLRWIIDAINLTSDIQVEKIDIDEIKPLLAEFISSFENEDNVLLADLLEYELLPKSIEWRQKIGATLAEHKE